MFPARKLSRDSLGGNGVVTLLQVFMNTMVVLLGPGSARPVGDQVYMGSTLAVLLSGGGLVLPLLFRVTPRTLAGAVWLHCGQLTLVRRQISGKMTRIFRMTSVFGALALSRLVASQAETAISGTTKSELWSTASFSANHQPLTTLR